MKKSGLYFIFIGCLLSNACGGEEEQIEPERLFVPTDVIVKVKGHVTASEVFDFINGFDHDVELIQNKVYNSNLPSDSLRYVLDYINEKPYTHSEGWPTGGYLHYRTKQITIFPRLFMIRKTEYQQNWIKTIAELKLTENTTLATSGYTIYFHVPEGREKEWGAKFTAYDFVEWAELNYIGDIKTGI